MRLAGTLACVLSAIWLPGNDESEPVQSDCLLTILDRQISQHHSRWMIRYKLRYDGSSPLDLTASDILLDYDAYVSNSHCRPHTTARRSQCRLCLSESNSTTTTVIASSNDRHRCREQLGLAVTTSPLSNEHVVTSKINFLPVHFEAGSVAWLYVTIDHDHFLHGSYDPLLGERHVVFQFGPCKLVDSIPLVQEHVAALPAVKLSAPAADRLDTRQYRSAPDSLYLAADVQNFQYFRFEDIPVRYGTSFRLSFWYLAAIGSEGTYQVRIMEYQDTPNAWYRLDGGGFDVKLTEQGEWQHFERTFRTLDDTTTMALDFRIVGANVGELWIDDIELTTVAMQAE